MKPNSALLIIDVQNDFCPGGALEVPDGDRIIPVINRLSAYFHRVIATQDWHPIGHISFAGNHPGYGVGDTVKVDGEDQYLWPEHCVPGTKGADLHPDLDTDHVHLILRKGFREQLDSYSAFFENDRKTPTGLDDYLSGLGIDELYLVGLALDYCVYYSAISAVQLGYRCSVIQDGTKGIDAPKGNLKKALDSMYSAGVHLIQSDSLALEGISQEERDFG